MLAPNQNMHEGLSSHHDGSVLYVSNQRPKLFDQVKVRIRVHDSFGKVAKVSARQVENGEAFFSQKSSSAAGENGWSWWTTEIRISNPSISYRFLIELVDGSCYWLNTLGHSRIEPLDAFDFRMNIYSDAPEWSKESVMYQIFPDRFARSSAADSRPAPSWAISKKWHDSVTGTGPNAGTELFGGDLDGIIEHLDHLEALGVSIVYLTPFFPAQSNHRYDASSFDQVDPLLGGDEALVRLVEAAHKRGMKVMGDLTSNHSGKAHEWFQAAYENPNAEESDFYYFSEGNKKYVSWFDVPSLPKFNWASQELRKRFVDGSNSVVAKWLKAPYKLDGWRIDVANMTGRLGDQDMYLEVGQLIKKTMHEQNPDTFLLGEYTSDAAAHIQGDGYHGAMTYYNFTKPLWRWFSNGTDELHPGFPGLGQSVLSAKDFVDSYVMFTAAFPWHVRQANMNALDTHDTPRFKTATLAGAQRVGAGLQFTLPGVPVVFAGDEFGLGGHNGENSRTPMPWNGERETDKSMTGIYSQLARLRKENNVLINGSLRWVYTSEEAVAFVREDQDSTILVAACRHEDSEIAIHKNAITDASKAENLFGGDNLELKGDQVLIPGKPMSVNVWRLPATKQKW